MATEELDELWQVADLLWLFLPKEALGLVQRRKTLELSSRDLSLQLGSVTVLVYSGCYQKISQTW